MATILPWVALALAALLIVSALLAVGFSAWTARKVETLLPPKGRFVDVPGARLHVREAAPDGDGDGLPPVVMIHGLAGQSAHFGYGIMPRLKGVLRMAAPDRPGCGYSTRAADAGADLPTQAGQIAALIDRLGLGRALVVGHSLGGAVALALALDHPDKVAGLVLLAPLTHIQDEAPAVFEGLTIASPLWRRILAWTLVTPLSIKQGAATVKEVFSPDPVPGDFPTRGGGLLGLRPSAFLGASSDLQALQDVLPAQAARYGELRMPVHLLYGRGDRILDWRHNGQGLADKVAHARLELVDGGHMLPVTHAERCAEIILAAARECAAGPARPAAQAGTH